MICIGLSLSGATIAFLAILGERVSPSFPAPIHFHFGHDLYVLLVVSLECLTDDGFLRDLGTRCTQ